jgi:hypothetical protein
MRQASGSSLTATAHGQPRCDRDGLALCWSVAEIAGAARTKPGVARTGSSWDISPTQDPRPITSGILLACCCLLQHQAGTRRALRCGPCTGPYLCLWGCGCDGCVRAKGPGPGPAPTPTRTHRPPLAVWVWVWVVGPVGVGVELRGAVWVWAWAAWVRAWARRVVPFDSIFPRSRCGPWSGMLLTEKNWCTQCSLHCHCHRAFTLTTHTSFGGQHSSPSCYLQQ